MVPHVRAPLLRVNVGLFQAIPSTFVMLRSEATKRIPPAFVMLRSEATKHPFRHTKTFPSWESPELYSSTSLRAFPRLTTLNLHTRVPMASDEDAISLFQERSFKIFAMA
jgi:hypothetical protein